MVAHMMSASGESSSKSSPTASGTMMTYHIVGCDRFSGADCVIDVAAQDEKEALTKAKDSNLFVLNIRHVDSNGNDLELTNANRNNTDRIAAILLFVGFTALTACSFVVGTVCDGLVAVWNKFNIFCRDQMNPEWAIEQKEEEIQDELTSFDNHIKEMLEQIEQMRLSRVRRARQRFCEADSVERACRTHLMSLQNDLFQLVDWADERAGLKSRYRAVFTCPFCRKMVYFKSRSASDTTVNCPYRECGKPIPVSFS
jgi:hypothetical protein